jgi:hypothetical protein
MHIETEQLELLVAGALRRLDIAEAAEIAWACVWLEACAYPGLRLLEEALGDEVREAAMVRDALGFDLAGASCVFLAPRIVRDVKANGRVFLRNVRHGLYLLPFSVRANLAIGCPVDPAFALGGERTRNPYAEKLELAETQGIAVDEELLLRLSSLPCQTGIEPSELW